MFWGCLFAGNRNKFCLERKRSLEGEQEVVERIGGKVGEGGVGDGGNRYERVVFSEKYCLFDGIVVSFSFLGYFV